MYDVFFARRRAASRNLLALAAASAAIVAVAGFGAAAAPAQDYQSSPVRRISALSEKLELITNSSRILTLDKNIPRVQVNNPELLAVTPLSATQVQISAKKAGVTQVNLWDEEGNIHTVDVMIYGDARELEVALQTQFPHSSIKVYRYSESLVLKGFVDRPDYVSQIMRLAEDYAPKVINNINVGGVQQILLKVKVMEISRTKLRRLNVDGAYLGRNGSFALSSVNGILSFDDVGDILTNNNDTFSFGIVNNGDRFLGFLEALQENRVAKILAEPNLVAVSGRPAQFNVGGEFPVLIPQSLGTSTIEYKPFGTQIDFLPIVLGNGTIRLEVRPRVSELDFSVPVNLNGSSLPALIVRQVDTAVEMKAGQTFAIAGLVQDKSRSSKRGLPYLSDLPFVGVPFRGTDNVAEEIELLILVTPEFVDPMDCHEVPFGGPGYGTTPPDNRDLYCGGHLEVPAHCNPIQGPLACGGDPYRCNAGYGNNIYHGNGGGGQHGHPQEGGYHGGQPNGSYHGGHSQGSYQGPQPFVTDGVPLPGGTGYDDSSYGPTTAETFITEDGGQLPPPRRIETLRQPQYPDRSLPTLPDELMLPMEEDYPPGIEPPDGASHQPVGPQFSARPQRPGEPLGPQATLPPQYGAPRAPVYLRNATRPNNQSVDNASSSGQTGQGASGLIGPVGYDVE